MKNNEQNTPRTTIMAFTWATMKNLFSKPVTKNYPAEPAVYPERSRGHVEIEIDKCISCGICAKSCPPGCLSVDRKEGTWTINRFDCIACGYCTLKCPKKCLHLAPGYQTPMGEKSAETFRRTNMPDPKAAKPAAAKPAAAPAAPAGKPAAKKEIDLSKYPPEMRAKIEARLAEKAAKEAKATAAEAAEAPAEKPAVKKEGQE